MLSHKTSLKKFKRTEVISSIFSDHKGYETRNQLQKEKHKYMETKPQATKKPMGQ